MTGDDGTTCVSVTSDSVTGGIVPRNCEGGGEGSSKKKKKKKKKKPAENVDVSTGAPPFLMYPSLYCNCHFRTS